MLCLQFLFFYSAQLICFGSVMDSCSFVLTLFGSIIDSLCNGRLWVNGEDTFAQSKFGATYGESRSDGR